MWKADFLELNFGLFRPGKKSVNRACFSEKRAVGVKVLSGAGIVDVVLANYHSRGPKRS